MFIFKKIIKLSKKIIMVYTKNMKQHNCFKIDNNKKWFLSRKSAY